MPAGRDDRHLGEARYTDTKTSLKDFKSVEFDCSGVGFQAGIMFDF